VQRDSLQGPYLLLHQKSASAQERYRNELEIQTPAGKFFFRFVAETFCCAVRDG